MNIYTKILIPTFATSLIVIPVFVFATNRFPKPDIVDDSIRIHRVKIEWEEQDKVDFYELKLLAEDGDTLIKKYTIDGDKHKKKIKNLDPDTTYKVRIRAQYKNGTHDAYSKRRAFTTLPDHPRFGINFVRFFSDDNEAIAAATQPEAVEQAMEDLGADGMRQLTSADLIWSSMETTDDVFDYTESDPVLLNTEQWAIVDLFSYQYADSTTPEEELQGDTTPEITFTSEAEEYVATVVDHYKDSVTYWEIGNEMMHWDLTNPGEFPVADQGRWLAAAADVIRAHDEDAQILLPGLVNITPDNVDDWLPGVVEAAGTDWFDIISYHDYNRWQQFGADRAALQTVLDNLGIADKPVWMTETGTSSDVTNTRITDYPNSPEQMAADIFRRSIQGYAAGDAFFSWHTFIGNDDDGESFRYFGLINEDLTKQLAYYSTQLLTSEVLPFISVENQGGFTYKITRNDRSVVYVAWSTSSTSWTVPEDMNEITSVVPNANGEFSWSTVQAGDTLTLTTIPILLR